MAEPVSADGWPVIPTYSDPRLGVYRVPGTTVELQLARAVGPLFAAFAADWHRHVAPITGKGVGFVGGYDPRKIAGSGTWSAHASGTAMDLGAQRFPQHQRRATPAQRTAVHQLLARYLVLEWGGDWSPGALDEMHVQLRQGSPVTRMVVTPADVAKVTAALGIQNDPLYTAPTGDLARHTADYQPPGAVGCRWQITLPRAGVGPVGVGGGDLCMDKVVAGLAITGGGLLTLAGIAVIAAAVLKGTGAGRAAAQAAAVVPVGRAAKAVQGRRKAPASPSQGPAPTRPRAGGPEGDAGPEDAFTDAELDAFMAQSERDYAADQRRSAGTGPKRQGVRTGAATREEAGF